MLVPPDDPVKLVCLMRAQRWRPAASSVGDVLRRVGARECARQRPLASGVRARRGIRRRARPQRLGGRLCRRARVRGRRLPAALRHRGPRRVPGSTRLAGGAGRPRTCWPVGPRRAGARPVRRALDADPPRSGPGRGGRLRLGTGGYPGTSPASHGFVHRPRSGPGGAPGGPAIVGPDPRCRPGDNTRRRPGPDGQPLAPLPGLGLPRLGPLGVLPIGRSVRLSRSAPGRHGPCLQCPGRDAGPDPAVGRQAVRGRRRAALVAPAGRPRRPHAHHRRPVLPAAGRPPLRHRDRRRCPARRASALPDVTGAAAGPGGGLRSAGGERAGVDRLRTLHAAPWSTATSWERMACR